jgi:hypothetical protein
MPKYNISEEKLNKIIDESIEQVLEEGLLDNMVDATGRFIGGIQQGISSLSDRWHNAKEKGANWVLSKLGYDNGNWDDDDDEDDETEQPSSNVVSGPMNNPDIERIRKGLSENRRR